MKGKEVERIKAGKTDSCLNGLVRPSCLIIDEIGHCVFDKENTRLFFDLIDRRCNKEGNYSMIFTGNKNNVLPNKKSVMQTQDIVSRDRDCIEALVNDV